MEHFEPKNRQKIVKNTPLLVRLGLMGSSREVGMAPDMMEWQWSDGSSWWDYQNTGWMPDDKSGYDCVYSKSGSWYNMPCEKDTSNLMGDKIHVVCSNPPTRMSGNHDLVFRKAALINPKFHLQM